MIKKDLGIYVHIPFCVKKCDYCDFLSGVATPEEQANYIRILAKEIRSYEALDSLYTVRTVYLGGGTPSILAKDQVEHIFRVLRQHFTIREDAEITIEANPGTLTAEKLRAYRGCGINRISIGLQSPVDKELKLLGRIHTYADFLDSYDLARKAGFDNINVDLMQSLPRQTVEGWETSLEKVAALGPEHISAYSLTIEEGTPFHERYTSFDGQRQLPSEKADRAMYHRTKEILEEHGYHRYEISNYAKEGKESRHNRIYWTLGEYLGVGLGASSYVDGKRFTNPRRMSRYWDYSRIAFQEFRRFEPQPVKDTMEEFMFLGLRMTEGISTEAFRRRFAVPYDEVYGEMTQELEERGYLKSTDGRVTLTDRGIDVSNRVLAYFLL